MRLSSGRRRTVALVPARGGSKGIPGKNIRLLGKHPLIAYSIAAGRLSSLVDDVIVSTDSPEIADVARRYGASVPFLRPHEISLDASPDIEFFKHYFEHELAAGSELPDLMVHLRPTTPFRQIAIIDDAIRYMIEHSEATSLRSMCTTRLTPYKMFRLHGEYAEPFLSYHGAKEFHNLPRQTFGDAYIANGMVDIIRPRVVMESGLLHGERIKLLVVDQLPDIDVEQDFLDAAPLLDDPRYRLICDYLEHVP